MARFIPKQFAENSTTSVVFGSFQEQGGNVGDGTISNDPATLQGGTAWPLGWKAATDNFFQIPRGEEMDGVNRVITAAIVQQFKDGLTFWQSEMPVTQYQTIVQYQTGSDLPKLYLNITGNSTSTPPDSDTTNWYMFLDTGASLANIDLSNLSATGQAKFDAKANVSNTVTTDAAQTITGAKTFQDGGSRIYAINTSLASNSTIPSSNILIGGIFTQAADGSLTGGFYSQTETTSQRSYSFVRKRINGTEQTAWSSLQILNDGTMFATAPTPPAGSVGAEIVTAGWFRQSGCTARTVIETYRSGANFYRVWSDGWIEQGGIGGTAPTVNLLKSFDTTDYTLIAMGRTIGTAYPMCEVVANRTKTSFYMASTATTTYEWYACGY